MFFSPGETPPDATIILYINLFIHFVYFYWYLLHAVTESDLSQKKF